MRKYLMINSIVIVIVNYYSSAEIIEYLKSITEESGITVVVVDNGDNDEDLKSLLLIIASLEYVTYIKAPSNIGYMGGARLAYEELDLHKSLDSFDWFILSNADIRIDANNLSKHLGHLKAKQNSEIPMLVAPKIESTLTGRNQNPYLVKRPSRLKYKLLALVFNIYPLAVAHRVLGIVKNKLKKSNLNNELSFGDCQANDCISIYGGHGSFMIFNNGYFKRGGSLYNESFLFCEENYVAEQVRKLKGFVCYSDKIVVKHKEHITTGIFPSKKMTKYLSKAHLICANRYMDE